MPKKKVKNKKPSKKYAKYKIGEGLERKPFCPRCGAGVFLAEHKNRQTCGSCGYTVFTSKK